MPGEGSGGWLGCAIPQPEPKCFDRASIFERMLLRKSAARAPGLALLLLSLFPPGSAPAQEPQGGRPPVDGAPTRAQRRFGQPGPQFQLVLAAVEQFRTDLDDGGKFSTGRYYVEPRLNWGINRDLSFALGLGTLVGDYRFEGTGGLAGLRPWDDVLSPSLNGFVRWGFATDWTLFAIPTVRAAAESGADLGDGVTGGILAGASYRFSETLTVGPGFGFLTQIEDDPSVFPILLIDWSLSEELALRTGGGVAATQGPGLTLAWQFEEEWEAAVGARYDRFRFRLDDSGVAPGGVGEDSATSVFATVAHTWESGTSLTLLTGLDLGGRLRLDDPAGNRLLSESFDPAPFVGFVLEARF